MPSIEYLGRAVAHQLHALARQVSCPTLLARIDVTFGQQSQPQQVRQIRRIREVPAVLEPLVLLDRARVCQMHLVAYRHQSVYQPVPVVRTLDHYACQIFPMRLQCGADLPQIVGQPLAEHNPVLFVADNHHRIVRVQAYATIFHVGLRRVKVQLRKLTLTPPLNRGEEAGYIIIIQLRESTRCAFRRFVVGVTRLGKTSWLDRCRCQRELRY
jgi:hypothetical protein